MGIPNRAPVAAGSPGRQAVAGMDVAYANESGAVRLHERAGFRVAASATIYRQAVPQ